MFCVIEGQLKGKWYLCMFLIVFYTLSNNDIFVPVRKRLVVTEHKYNVDMHTEILHVMNTSIYFKYEFTNKTCNKKYFLA